jgi:hypothetical protein
MLTFCKNRKQRDNMVILHKNQPKTLYILLFLTIRQNFIKKSEKLLTNKKK